MNTETAIRDQFRTSAARRCSGRPAMARWAPGAGAALAQTATLPSGQFEMPKGRAA